LSISADRPFDLATPTPSVSAAECGDKLRLIEQPRPFLLARAITNIWVIQDLVERSPARALADDVSDEVLLSLGSSKEGSERVAEEAKRHGDSFHERTRAEF
jgi:hypothetical protein